ncbi:MAG: TraR/DksA family transcriptional regulator [Chlorobiales bacterium]|nr:TraR/DksA family transcriptional regulator [Chlorobiales bacterium]
MWITRKEMAAALGIQPNSVRAKVKKGQIERTTRGGKNYYRIVESTTGGKTARQFDPPPLTDSNHRQAEPRRMECPSSGSVNPKEVLLDQLASIKVAKTMDAIQKGDDMDLATDEINRDLEATLSMFRRKRINEIEAALKRIEQGEYGICEECGEDIPEARLRLFPAAEFCVGCQEEHDKLNKARGASESRDELWL